MQPLLQVGVAISIDVAVGIEGQRVCDRILCQDRPTTGLVLGVYDC